MVELVSMFNIKVRAFFVVLELYFGMGLFFEVSFRVDFMESNYFLLCWMLVRFFSRVCRCWDS